MLRRVHLSKLTTGSIALPQAEAHHVRDVLRLEAGSQLELFDNSGNVATGIIKHVNVANVVVDIESIAQANMPAATLTVAAAIPKGDRADWMVEKLTELGVNQFIPLVAERSVVVPAGRNKIQRWERIAIESAKQSRRAGVMQIAPIASLDEIISSGSNAIYFSTTPDAIPIAMVLAELKVADLTLLIGPEGGWSEIELTRMKSAGFVATGLTSTILRVETAAIVAAALVMCRYW